MILIASWVHRNAPDRLVSTTDLHCSYVTSSIGTACALTPALLNRRSSRLYVSSTVQNRARTDAGSLTSVGTPSTLRPSLVPSAAVASKDSFRRPATTTE